MKKKLLITLSVFAVLLVGYFIVKGNKGAETNDVIVPVDFGVFKVEIETTGELEAKSSVPIKGPTNLRNFRIYNLTIQKIVDEGTVVSKGQWIANLDKSEFQTKISDKQIELDKATSQFTQVQLDTMLQMRQARDELVNLQYAVEEQDIILQQSQFEPPATIKQAEINLDKAKRALTQAEQNYKIKKRQNIERMRQVSAELRKVRTEYNMMQELQAEFTILAPEPGMVIYKKGRDGRQIKEGSQISMWDPVVATLPDLTTMISKTYVNEVDVRKVQTGQPVEIGLDAFPEKNLQGIVTRVANVGEQRPNSDAKVFEVTVEIEGTDPTLRPAMTTSNKILANVIDSVMFIPLESLHSHADSIAFVYKREGIGVIKQEVKVGLQNTDDAVIEMGLAINDRVYLSVPKGMEETEVALIPEMNGQRNIRKKDMEEVNPEMKTITLPDGRTIAVPAKSGGAPQGDFTRGQRRQGGERRRPTSEGAQKKGE